MIHIKSITIIVGFIVSLSGVTFMSKAQPLTDEQPSVSAQQPTQYSPFWETGTFSSFGGKDNVRINYASFTSPAHAQCIILVPGRSEGYLKYKELSEEFFNQGYDIHIIDHRGQGISQRMTSNPHKGYVKNFDDYSEDLHQFVKLVSQNSCQTTFLLAHSMGGAIAARYLQQYDTPITAAVFASPMIAINSGGLPTWLAQGIISTGITLNKLFSHEPWYFLGQGDYQPTPFSENVLTHSAERYKTFADLYQQTPEIQLGGVTFHWLGEAVKANKDIFADIEKLTTPTIVLQSGSDKIVDNLAQTDFCRALHHAHPHSCPTGDVISINAAHHELFFEEDKYRAAAIKQVLTWFSQHNAKN